MSYDLRKAPAKCVPLNEELDPITLFADKIDDLITLVIDKHPADGIILNYHMKIETAKKHDPSIIIKKAGPAIFNEREIIIKGVDALPSIDTSRIEEADFRYIVTLLRSDWESLDRSKKSEIHNKIKDLLKIYIMYIKQLK